MNTCAGLLKDLVGKTIVDVVSLGKGDIEDLMWYCDPADTILLKFNDGTGAIVMADPEGNDTGWLEMVTLTEEVRA